MKVRFCFVYNAFKTKFLAGKLQMCKLVSINNYSKEITPGHDQAEPCAAQDIHTFAQRQSGRVLVCGAYRLLRDFSGGAWSISCPIII